MPGLGKCTKCSKTVYDIEGFVVGPPNKTQCFHKICFKCSVCGWTLNMNTYRFYEDKVYCANHYPVNGFGVKDHVTGNQKMLSQSEQNMKNAPKLDTVNEQVRGGNEKPNMSTDSMTISNAVKAPKLGVVNEQIRGDSGKTGVGLDSMQIKTATQAPKVGAKVNEQVRDAKFCPKCGQMGGGAYCGNCGEVLRV